MCRYNLIGLSNPEHAWGVPCELHTEWRSPSMDCLCQTIVPCPSFVCATFKPFSRCLTTIVPPFGGLLVKAVDAVPSVAAAAPG